MGRVSLCRAQCVRFMSTVTKPKAHYDAVIVGGGHNGLVAAAYLQKSGAQVCVLERRHILGGAAVTEEIVPGFKFSRASYVLSLLRPHIYTDLQLKKHGLKVYTRNPSSYTPLQESLWRKAGPRSLTLGSNESSNIQQISQFSEKDAKAYTAYEKQLLKLVSFIEPLLDLSANDALLFLQKHSKWQKLKDLLTNPQLRKTALAAGSLGGNLCELQQLLTVSASSYLSRWFESEPLKATLATDAVIGTMASPETPGNGYTLLHHVMGQVEGIPGAWGYPEGGMGSVTQALASAAASYGVHLFTNVDVSSINLNDSGKAVGVTTADGQEISAKVVLSNATPHVTFLKLLPTNTLSEDFHKAISSIDYSSPVTKINVAVDKLPNFVADPCVENNKPLPLHQCTIHLNCENTALVTNAYNCAKTGHMPDRPMIEMVIPSSLDPTLAPKGCHVCLLFTQYTPYHLSDGDAWDDKKREEYADKVFSSIEEYAPGFRASIIGKEVLSPPDLENIFGLTGGNIFHGALSLNQLFVSRPAPLSSGPASPFTPVPHLLLCGSGAHPGGGVMGSPGYLAAQATITLLKAKLS